MAVVAERVGSGRARTKAHGSLMLVHVPCGPWVEEICGSTQRRSLVPGSPLARKPGTMVLAGVEVEPGPAVDLLILGDDSRSERAWLRIEHRVGPDWRARIQETIDAYWPLNTSQRLARTHERRLILWETCPVWTNWSRVVIHAAGYDVSGLANGPVPRSVLRAALARAGARQRDIEAATYPGAFGVLDG